MITQMQRRVLWCLQDAQDNCDRITFRQIAAITGYASVSTVDLRLRELAALGYIKQVKYSGFRAFYEVVRRIEPPRLERADYFTFDRSTKSLVPRKGRAVA